MSRVFSDQILLPFPVRSNIDNYSNTPQLYLLTEEPTPLFRKLVDFPSCKFTKRAFADHKVFS